MEKVNQTFVNTKTITTGKKSNKMVKISWGGYNLEEKNTKKDYKKIAYDLKVLKKCKKVSYNVGYLLTNIYALKSYAIFYTH